MPDTSDKTKRKRSVHLDPGNVAIYILLLGILGYFIFRSPDESEFSERETQRVSNSLASVSNQQWYEDGTLHRSNLREWRASTTRNQLATAGDMLTVIKQQRGESIPNLDLLRREALTLVECISDTAGEDDLTSNQGVSEVAVACYLLM